MPFEVDFARAASSPDAREALVRAVLGADRTMQETDWIEWKGLVDVLEWAPLIAKHILGFANRDPGRAARVVEGCGYLLPALVTTCAPARPRPPVVAGLSLRCRGG